MTKRCIYCDKEKEEKEFSLEHVIPQFMGGAYSEDIFKTRDVCGSCNSVLGLYVDASFEKTWMVSAWLQQSYMGCFDPTSPHPIPLICMGISTLSPPNMTADEVCEAWLGPLGEQVYWVRPKDDDKYWYVGGNPITTKSKGSRAYFFFSNRTPNAPQITLFSFKSAFKDRKKVKKILCGNIDGASASDFGFQPKDSLDTARMDYFMQQQAVRGVGHTQISFYMEFDRRFVSKLALGVGYCLLGRAYLESPYAKELRSGIWYRGGDSAEIRKPEVYAGSTFMQSTAPIPKHLLEEHAVTIIMVLNQIGLCLNLNLGISHSWTILCAPLTEVTPELELKIGSGLVVVLYRCLSCGVEMPMFEYINYKLGHSTHSILTPISNRIQAHRTYFKDL